MAHSSFKIYSDDEDEPLILCMDGENKLTGHPKTIDKVLERRKPTELRIIRILARAEDEDPVDSSEEEEEDARPKVRLTFEELLPGNGEEGSKIGDTTVPPDIVDPLSQMDTEQMLKLKKALASDQAKQLLGDDVTAMLDVLSVDENPTVFLQNSIRRDHCYTPLSPSADPNGASFVNSGHVAPIASIKRGKGRPPKNEVSKASGSGLCHQIKPTSVASPEVDVADEDDESYENSSEDSDDRDRSSDSDYHDRNSGFMIRGRKKMSRGRMRGAMKGLGRGGVKRGRGRPRRERTGDEDKSSDLETSPEVVPESPTIAPIVHFSGKRGRPRKENDAGLIKKPIVTPVPAPVQPVEPTPIDHAAAKVYSADAIRLGRPTGKSEEERRRDLTRIIQSLDGARPRKVIVSQINRPVTLIKPAAAPVVQASVSTAVQPAIKSPEPMSSPLSVDSELKDMLDVLEEGSEPGEVILVKKTNKPVRTYEKRESGSKDVKEEILEQVNQKKVEVATPPPTTTATANVMGGKYPRRENRKLPSHLVDTVGPELFSSPDVLRKKNAAGEEASQKKTVQKSLLKYVKKNVDSPPQHEPEVRKDTITAPAPVVNTAVEDTVTSSGSDALTDAVNELQTMLEEGLADNAHPIDVKTDLDEKPAQEIPRNSKKPSEQEVVKKISEGRRSSKAEIRMKPKPEEEVKVNLDVEMGDFLQCESMEVVMDVTAEVASNHQNVVVVSKPTRGTRTSKDGKHTNVVESPKQDSKPTSVRASRSSKDDAAKELHVVTDEANVETVEKESPSGADERRRNATKRRRSDEVSDLDSDIDDTLSEASWNSEDDPEKLWCICRQPHNNRFMICCDVCEDWFHGKCVGITKSIGKQMEQDGLEWTCPPCTKKKRAEEKEKEMVKMTKVVKDTKQTVQTKLQGFAIAKSATSDDGRKCIMCKAPVRENSIYCSDQCIRKHSQRAIAQLGTSSSKPAVAKPAGAEPVAPRREDHHLVVMDPRSKKVLAGQSAPTISNLATWLQQNPSFHVLFDKKTTKVEPTTSKGEGVKMIQLPHMALNKAAADGKNTQMKLTVSPNSKHIKIISRAPAPGQPVLKVVPTWATGTIVGGRKVLTLTKPDKDAGPSKLKQDPIKLPEKKVNESPKTAPRRRKEKLTALQDFKPPGSTKMEEAREKTSGTGEQAIRDSVRKTLGESLKTRVAECKDLDVKESVIDDLAVKIEDRLYKLFENKVDVKYKSKYRSIVFNIKDQKNETLFRKIVENSISPKELVRLTPDEMASQELAQWREKENQHQLEIIKKTELELMTLGQTFILKSHKGEEVIEKDLKVAAVAAEIDPNTSAQELVSALNSVSSTTPDTGDTNKKEKGSETSLMKMKKKEKERQREREKKRKRDRERGRDRSHSRHSKTRKRSKSRSRDRRRRSRSRDRKGHKDSKSRSSRRSKDSRESDKSKERKEKQGEEPAVISTSEDVERKEKESISDDADYEPTSTVTIQTPEPVPEEVEEPVEPLLDLVWSGEISMADVAKFQGKAIPAAGSCSEISSYVADELSIVGRIPYDVVWEYIAKTKKVANKDIIILQMLPADIGSDSAGFDFLHSYLSKRARMGVIGPNREPVKDFYLFPHCMDSPLPEVLHPLTIPLKNNSNVILGIVLKSKRGARRAAVAQPKPALSIPKSSLPLPPVSPAPMSKAKALPLPESPPDQPRSLTPPTSDPETRGGDPRKRKIRVVKVPKAPAEEDDSPYSPASSDEDLPPLSKISKKTTPAAPIPSSDAAALAEAEIQKEIEEMNRAIEEEKQQIQTLASTVPLLPVLATAVQAAAAVPTVPPLDLALQALQTIAAASAKTNEQHEPEKDDLEPQPMDLDIPLPSASSQQESENVAPEEIEPYSPTGSPISEQVDSEPVPPPPPTISLPEVAQISIPSNLQEILASIKSQPSAAVTSPPSSPPPSPPSSPPVSPEPLPPGVEEAQVVEPPVAKKAKPDRKAVFESDGVPEFVSAANKMKPIKFAFKIKSGDENDLLKASKDIDERTSLVSVPPTVPPPPPTMSSSDLDERVMKLAEDLAPKPATLDRDDRVFRHSQESDDSKDRSKSKSSYADKDDRDRRRGRRDSDPHHKSDRHKESDPMEAEWEGSIRRYEEDLRRRNQRIRSKEIERLKQRADESD